MRKSRRPIRTSRRCYDLLTAYSSNGYQWFQVAEVGYDNFMARHSQS